MIKFTNLCENLTSFQIDTYTKCMRPVAETHRVSSYFKFSGLPDLDIALIANLSRDLPSNLITIKAKNNNKKMCFVSCIYLPFRG